MTVAMVGRFRIEAKIVPMRGGQGRWWPMGHELTRFDDAVLPLGWILRMPGVQAVAVRQLEP